jgi:hypothetical protein
LLADIEAKKALGDDLRKRLTAALEEYKQDFKAKLADKDHAKQAQPQTAGAAA